MTLLASFHYSVADAQQASRRVHKAISEPGVIVSLPLMPGQRELSSAASALLLKREEGADTLWLDPQIDSAALRSTLHFCTGMPLVSACNASLALSHARANPDPATLMARQAAAGHNRTLIIELPGLNGGLTLRLSGDGLRETRAVAPQLPPACVSIRIPAGSGQISFLPAVKRSWRCRILSGWRCAERRLSAGKRCGSSLPRAVKPCAALPGPLQRLNQLRLLPRLRQPFTQR